MQKGVSRSRVELGTALAHSFSRHMPFSMALLHIVVGKGLPFLTEYFSWANFEFSIAGVRSHFVLGACRVCCSVCQWLNL